MAQRRVVAVLAADDLVLLGQSQSVIESVTSHHITSHVTTSQEEAGSRKESGPDVPAG